MDNIRKLIKLMGNNCKVVDISTCKEEKDKLFSVVRRYKKYDFDVDFDSLIKAGFYPKYMHMYIKKDEIVFEVR